MHEWNILHRYMDEGCVDIKRLHIHLNVEYLMSTRYCTDGRLMVL